MCLLVLAYQCHPEFPLIIAANRDEFFRRPTAPADFWDDQILAGRDLEAGGTWMGVTKAGRFAALTNVRDPKFFQTGKNSRGLIVSNFLQNNVAPQAYLTQLAEEANHYNGFNVIVGNVDQLFYFNSTANKITELAAGIHGLSNDQLNTPWPKVVRAKSALEKTLIHSPNLFESKLFELLRDDSNAADDELPDTGVGVEKERWLSPIFICTKEYGTRCSTLLLSRRDGDIQYIERTFDSESDAVSLCRYRFELASHANT